MQKSRVAEYLSGLIVDWTLPLGLYLVLGTFAIMVTLAASLSFLTPLEPACLLVYGPGRYRFVDFVKSGSVLTLLSLVLLLFLVPLIWPFELGT